ncbi:hypothetical protein Vadar_001347 [Vaccinium darrowii]|uniref:Uncharacterized protein n=1 Tax=Vaccinium darrowii TaxID=229202 RepID=A0ACB7WWY1_9ERIC|nr:hypothetical protein Vadar_001347 [Vaccinium darrowii]
MIKLKVSTQPQNPRNFSQVLRMSRVYVGNLDPRVSERELEDEFRVYGVLRSVWVARRPPGYAFIEFDDKRDALDAIRELDGKNGWRVELSHNSKEGTGRRGGGGGGDLKCYECALALDAAVVQFMGVGVIAHMGDGPHVDLATAGHLLIAALTGINLHCWVVFWQKLNAGGRTCRRKARDEISAIMLLDCLRRPHLFSLLKRGGENSTI